MTVQFWRRGLLTLTTIGIAVTGTACLGAAAHATSSSSSFEELARDAGVPGGAVAYLDSGSVERVETFGRTGSGQQVGPSTRMLWGSTSKPVAATVTVRLAADGVVDLDAQVAEYVGGAPDVPVRSLLDHTSGLPFGAAELDVTRPGTDALEVATGIDADAGQSGAYQYSSLGYLYLQAVTESATGLPYSDSLALVAPGAGASADECGDVPAGHRLAGPFALDMETGYDGAGAAYGYTCGSIEDLAQFAVSQLDSSSGTLDAQTVDTVDTGQPGTRYGHGWRVTTEPDGGTTVWHTGTVPGYFSAIYLDPSTGDGAVVLLNASGYLHEEALAAITRAAYDHATGRDIAVVPSAWLASAASAALLLTAAIAVVALIRGRSTRLRAVMVWAILVALAAVAALVIAPGVLGVPLRYFWLWEPALVIGAGALLTALLAGLTTSVVRLQR